jgi:HD-GYP domain-containing protein (c-di-GMP phosphodiesterase class II)
MDAHQAHALRDKIIDAVLRHNDHDEPSVAVSISVGVATSTDEPTEDAYDLYQRADDDMYQYKMSQSRSPKSTVVDMMLTALSERDFVTEGHVERLVRLASAMAEAMSLPDKKRRDLILLAKMHDLGKVGVPDEILFKPNKLSTEEYAQVQKHVNIGYRIASRSRELSHIANLVLHHHEFWNGDGYPAQLKGEDIPLECRIINIIDAYDAMTNRRPYSEGVDQKDALEELLDKAGIQFDPILVKVFVQLMESSADNLG